MEKRSSSKNEKEVFSDTIMIDASTKEFFNKETLLELLQSHCVDTDSVEDSKIRLEDVIPALQKTKIKIPEKFYKELAGKLNIPFIDYYRVKRIYEQEEKVKLVSILPYPIISKYKVVPLTIKGQVVDLAIDNPLDNKVLVTIRYLFSSWKINLRVVSSRSIEWAIDNIYREIHKKNALLDLYNRSPDQSAYRVLYPKQKYFILTVIFAITVSLIIDSAVTFMLLFAVISITYFIVNPIKIYISIRGFKGGREPTKITKGEIQWTREEDLPVYTILIPVYREAAVLSQNMRNMYQINYPKDKLDIKILMEENDHETINEAKKNWFIWVAKKIY